MTNQNQQIVMLKDWRGNEYHVNMQLITAIFEQEDAEEVLLCFGNNSAIKIPKLFDELIEKHGLNETAGFVVFTDPDNGNRIMLNTHNKPLFVGCKYEDRSNIAYDNGIQIIVKGSPSEVLEKLGMV
ncbi:hypothetical protein [Pasteurella multocida]|uniref:hypothetical protein n=1 Tax=Pasteurella multocida TaxID=747 RepID=UPI002B5D204A|nr:hypothetical protein [Pasteurella multocida]MEB3457363.1 hypothetical protein [Pasteurella multocida]